ncbi:MAG: amidase domain-containing protein [Oscillospiraceae bacterium]|nr:amidase domain-containing protein [Oscillospiraceae bacterium]
MRKIIAFFIAAFLITGCAQTADHPVESVSSAIEPAPPAISQYASVEPMPEPVVEEVIEPQPFVAKADSARSDKETIELYFKAHYDSYITMLDADITEIIDMENSNMKNLTVWLSMLNQRRRLLKENEFCYVETTPFEYEIVYEDTPEDDRMNFWQRRMKDNYDAVYHFRIRGEQGKAYPPTFAFNSQHSIFLKKIDGVWKIVRHYYPGAVRNFYSNSGLELKSDEETLQLLKEEFAAVSEMEEKQPPQGARIYDSARAAEYAIQYAEKPNEKYYNVGDWHGNCQNFVSQAVSSGFGDEQNPDPMTKKWFAGSGGGTSPWENCDYFWNYAVNGGGIGGSVLESVTQLKAGDVMQIRSLGRNNPDDFSHVLMLIDKEKLVFAQNSPANFVYYSDLVNIAARFFSPEYLYSDY